MPRSSDARPSSADEAALRASSRQRVLAVKLPYPFGPVLGLLQLSRFNTRHRSKRFLGFAGSAKLAVGAGQQVMGGAVIIRGGGFLEFCLGFVVLSNAVIGLAKPPVGLRESGLHLQSTLQQRNSFFRLILIDVDAAQIGVGIGVEWIDLQLLLKLERRFLEAQVFQVHASNPEM